MIPENIVLPPEDQLPQFDRAHAFLIFAAHAGDVEKTAFSLNISPVQLLRAAEELGWYSKLKAIFELKKSSRPGDLERALNRCMSFAQAQRMRNFLDRIITRLSAMENAELDDYLFSVNAKTGEKKLVTRALCDLSSACEKVSAQAAAALADTAQDRAKRDEDTASGEASGSIHQKIAAAMSAIGKDVSPRALLLEAQISQGQAIVADAARAKVEEPIDPYSKD